MAGPRTRAALVRRSRLPLLALVAGAILALGACTGSPAGSGSASPAPSGSAASSAAPGPSASASASPSLATLPAEKCLTGSYALVRFVAANSQTYGTGQGGDVTVTFDGKAYTLTGAGKKGIELTLGGSTGTLLVDGKVDGTFVLDGTTATFKPGTTTGSGTVQLGGASKKLTMDQVTSVIGLQGEGEVACTAAAMTITFPTVRLELGRA